MRQLRQWECERKVNGECEIWFFCVDYSEIWKCLFLGSFRFRKALLYRVAHHEFAVLLPKFDLDSRQHGFMAYTPRSDPGGVREGMGDAGSAE